MEHRENIITFSLAALTIFRKNPSVNQTRQTNQRIA